MFKVYDFSSYNYQWWKLTVAELSIPTQYHTLKILIITNKHPKEIPCIV